MTIATIFFLLLAGHALCDYPLQGDYMAKAKDRHLSNEWWMVLPAHGVIHGGMVFLVTQSLVLGVAETIAHSVIDYAKCEEWIDYKTDQALHVWCKLVWVFYLLMMVS